MKRDRPEGAGRKVSTGDLARGRRIERLRLQRRLTRKELAEQIDRSVGWLFKVETGQSDPSSSDLVSLACVLRTDPAQLLTGEQHAPATRQARAIDVADAGMLDDVKRRVLAQQLALGVGAAALGLDVEHLASILAGNPPDESSLDDFETLTRHFVRGEATLTPGALLPAVRGHLQGFRDMLMWTPPAHTRRLCSLAGQTALLAGYLMFKLARHADADVYWLLAARFGELAEDARLRAALLALRALRRREDGHVVDALQLLDQAMSVLGPAPEPDVAAHVLMKRGRYRAEASEADSVYADQALRDLDSVQDHLSRLHSDATVYIVESVRGEAIEMRGSALHHLNRAGEAVADLEQLLASMGDASLTWRCHVVGELAIVRSKMGDPDRACGLLSTGLSLAVKASAPRSVNRIRERREWITDYDGAALRDLDEQLRALPPTAVGAFPTT